MRRFKLFDSFNDPYCEENDMYDNYPNDLPGLLWNTDGYLIDGEIIDTYGGDFTYKDVRWEYFDGKFHFYEQHYGAKPEDEFEIDDSETIEEYTKMVKKYLK